MRSFTSQITIGFVSMAISALGCTAPEPDNLGVSEGKLAPCPETPNCVSSQSDTSQKYVEPLVYQDSTNVMARLAEILARLPRVKVITQTETYLHAEFKIAVFGFIDDVEFLLDEPNQVIHVRSASRVGRSDLGVNRRRVESIRKKWLQNKRSY